jgi:hypothetical protein
MFRVRTPVSLLLASCAVCALAQESRSINPIARPQGKVQLRNDGAVPINPPQPVAREKVEAAIRRIAAAWSERKLDRVLSQQFSDRQRLIDALETKVPRDARLRVVGIQGWQVLDQHRRGPRITSKLSVTVSTQVEFSDSSGYQVRPGTNVYIISIVDGGAP